MQTNVWNSMAQVKPTWSGFALPQLVCVCLTRMEEFAKEKVDLTIATSLSFDTPLADMSDVKTMMDSINIVPGLTSRQLNAFLFTQSMLIFSE